MKKKALYVLIGLLIGALGIFVAARQRSAAETRVVVATASPVPPTSAPVPPAATSLPPTSFSQMPTGVSEPWDALVSALAGNLREFPHLNSQIMHTLIGGAKVDLLAVTEDNKWVHVTSSPVGGNPILEGWLQVDKLRLNVSLDDLEVDTETVFVQPPREGDQPAAPAPEPTPLGGGGKIAFSSDRDGDFEIYLMNSDGTNQIRLTNQSTTDYFPEFSPDGDMLLFWAVDPQSIAGLGDYQFVGTDGTYMGTLLGLGWGSSSWSPDGKSIALAIRTGADNWEILIAEFGGMPRLLSSNPAADLQPEWSPDGKTLAFASLRDGISKIYLMDASGNNVRRLTESDENDIEPSWSPDGTKIAFVSGDNVNTQIYIMNSDGTEVTQVTEGLGYNEHPSWSPDGTMLAFWSNRSGNNQIYTIRTDGTELTRLTSNEFDDVYPDWAHSATEMTPPTFPPVTADDPFIGTWLSVDPADESNQQLWISGGNGVYNIFYIDLVATSCGLDGAGNSIAGYGISTGTADGNVLSTDIVYWCLTDPQSFLATVHTEQIYDVSRDILLEEWPGWPSFIWSRR